MEDMVLHLCWYLTGMEDIVFTPSLIFDRCGGHGVTPLLMLANIVSASHLCWCFTFKRVRMQVVVVVVRELLFLVTSVICVWIRGYGSEVTTSPYHIHSDFRLKHCSHHNGFVVLFLHYFSCKCKSYRYSVQLGILGADRTIFGITLSVSLSVHLYISQSVILSMCPILSGRYLLNHSTIFNKLVMVVYYQEVECQAEKLVHYLQCQGHSEGLYNWNTTISTISSKLWVRLQPNLVW